MVFGFKSKKKSALNTLNEKDIRSRLYGSAVGVAMDFQDKPLNKKDRGDEDRAAPAQQESGDERAKIREELQSIKKELEQAKRKLKRVRGVRTKKIWLLTISFMIFFILATLATVTIGHFFKAGKKEAQQPATVSPDFKYSIQVAVSGNEADAQKFSTDLISKGYSSFIKRSSYGSGKAKFMIYVGGFKDMKAASKILARLKTKEGITDSFITSAQK